MTDYDSSSTNIYLQAPYNGTFILAVCENVTDGNCGNHDHSGTNPMYPYTFTTTLGTGGTASRTEELTAGAR